LLDKHKKIYTMCGYSYKLQLLLL